MVDLDRISNVKLQFFCEVFFFLIFIQAMVKLILEDCLLVYNKFLEEKLHVPANLYDTDQQRNSATCLRFTFRKL